MLTANIGYGIGINWDVDDFPTSIFEDLGKQSQKELVEDHLEYEGQLPEGLVIGAHISKQFDNCARYACLLARVITGFPLLEAYTSGFYSDDENPFVVVYLPSTRQDTRSGNVSPIGNTEGTDEEREQMAEFCRRYFPNKQPQAIFWAGLS